MRGAKVLGILHVTTTAIAVTCLLSSSVNAATTCLDEARQAEERLGIPDNILVGIVMTESGGHPWTTNHRGDGRFFGSRREAATYINEIVGEGDYLIDVGCAQINLRWHSGAFENPEAGLDPQKNLDYAADHLVTLYERAGSWRKAVGDYHSPSDDARANAYADKVFAAAAGKPLPRVAAVKAPGRKLSTAYQNPGRNRVSELDGVIGNIHRKPREKTREEHKNGET